MKPQVQTDAGDSLPQRLSALCDGEARGPELDAALQAWRDDAPQARQRWHAYTLIGDVLRSDDLCPRSAGHDAAFLARFQQRLAQEPVVLAPKPDARAVVSRSAVRTWRRLSAPMAMAAGVMTVVGVAVMMRPGAPESMAPAQMAQVDQGVQPVSTTAAPRNVAAVAPAGSDVLLRDPLLDRYLEEHRLRSRGATVALSPEDGVRQVVVPAR
ncbi:sigma-E factor negative regulatory protein [Ideonella sp. 4Y16]|uniref:Sigma-E factor negative regulatory protein n=1 Tax=Ideonella alba TaxID=2824118 RepID=A0A940Y7I2_9BURK|nr:sigma-E factor negative regulatory protein [Ideonella alba]MBQ0929665.1 sigma-E factor negative regulatory protein [Ideonella alba]MBQ0941907.1 sigma-E factor negative regulatory protein [Ideonella alba]